MHLFTSLTTPVEGQGAAVAEAPVVMVGNKCDLTSDGGAAALAVVPVTCHHRFSACLAVSAATGSHLPALEDAIERAALGGGDGAGAGGRAWAVNDRQADALVRAAAALRRVGDSAAQGLPLDFWTVDLRDAAYALSAITGDAATEGVLDVVFSKFCIGK